MVDQTIKSSWGILVLDQNRIRNRDKDFIDLEDQNHGNGIEILSPQDASEKGYLTHDGLPFSSGAIYIKSPLSSSVFCLPEVVSTFFPTQQYNKLQTLMNSLGAKHFKTILVTANEEHKTNTFKMGINATIEGVSGEARLGLDKNELATIGSWLNTEIQGPGLTSKQLNNSNQRNEINILLSEIAAIPDATIFSDFAKTRLGANPPSLIKRQLNFTSSHSTITKFVTGLKVPGVFGIDTNSLAKTIKSTSFSITLEVEFPKEPPMSG